MEKEAFCSVCKTNLNDLHISILMTITLYLIVQSGWTHVNQCDISTSKALRDYGCRRYIKIKHYYYYVNAHIIIIGCFFSILILNGNSWSQHRLVNNMLSYIALFKSAYLTFPLFRDMGFLWWFDCFHLE